MQGVDTRRLPVEHLTWFDAVLFCNKLSQRERLPVYYAIQGATVVADRITQAQVKVIGGNGYRLPTEAEWEFACRSGRYESAGMETVHIKGDSIPLGGRPSPVGSDPPNDFGLFDMQDNVTEWCQDWYSYTYYKTSPRVNPVGPLFGDKRACVAGRGSPRVGIVVAKRGSLGRRTKRMAASDFAWPAVCDVRCVFAANGRRWEL